MPTKVFVEPPGALPATIPYVFGLAALGPDYGVGNAPSPTWGSEYTPPQPIVIPENYAWVGPVLGREAGKDRVSSIKLDTGLGPVWFPNFNLAEPQGLYRLQIINAEQLAIQETSWGNVQIDPIPVTYEPGGPATLYGGK